jgi:hypothetical protein
MKKIALLLTLAWGSAFAQDEEVFKPVNQDSLNAFTKGILSDDFSGYIKGHDAVLSEIIPIVTASKLISEYKNNELAADKKYKDKPVRIKTVASAIKSDIGGRGFIVASGANAYSNVYIYINEKDDRILSLGKGSKIDFICYGNGMTLNTPMLKPCEFTGDFIQSIEEQIEKNIGRASGKNYQPRSKLELYIMALYKFYEPYLGESCVKSSVDCFSTFKNINKNKTKEELEEMNGRGEEVNKLFEPIYDKYKELPSLPVEKKTALLKIFE